MVKTVVLGALGVNDTSCPRGIRYVDSSSAF